jgi:hypothetical protein
MTQKYVADGYLAEGYTITSAGFQNRYTDLITSEHIDKPNFNALVAATCQPNVDLIALYSTISALYDVDTAVGEQLDVVGQWVGVSRDLNEPLTGVYFSLDTVGAGLDQGIWQGPFDSSTGLVSLPDEYYRILIKVRILNNHWNGSKENANILVNNIFSAIGYTFFIEDPSDLSMRLGLIGSGPPTALATALLLSGKFNIKPAGVHIASYIYQSAPGPIFAFDLNSTLFAGFDSGAWATIITN